MRMRACIYVHGYTLTLTTATGKCVLRAASLLEKGKMVLPRQRRGLTTSSTLTHGQSNAGGFRSEPPHSTLAENL